MQSWFNWKGKNSREMGVWVTTIAGETRAPERVNYIKVPGRSGTLKMTEGDNVYDAYTMQIVITAQRNGNLERLTEWLSGSGDLILSDSPNRAREAEISSLLAFNNISNDLCQATIPFYCQPFKKQFPSEGYFLGQTATYSIYNPGNVPSKPLVIIPANSSTPSLRIANRQMNFSAQTFSTSKAYAPGDFVVYDINGIYRFTQAKSAGAWDVSKVVAIGNIVIDCESKAVYAETNGVYSVFHGNITGDFFEIPVGSSYVYATPANSPKIQPRWRWL